MTDITLRYVDGYGWLPIVAIDDKEVYRGEFCTTGMEAYTRCQAWLMKQESKAND